MGLQKTVFGRQKAKPNTFIGGVSGTINTPDLIATRLGINVNRIKAFSIIGSNIQFAVTGGTYGLPTNAFRSSAITYFNDVDGLVLSLNTGVFYGATSLTTVTLPNLTTITTNGSGNDTFGGCTLLNSLIAPKVVNINGIGGFVNCTALTTLNFPLYNGPIISGFLQNCSSLTSINLTITGAIGNNAFTNTKISTIDLSAVTSIGSGAFNGVSTLVGNLTANMCTTIGSNAFRNTRITGFTSSSCTSIDLGAFYSVTTLASVVLNAVTVINSAGSGNDTFGSCTGLVSFSAPNLTTINGINMLASCSNITTIYMPSITKLGDSVSVSQQEFLNIKLGATITVPIAMQTINGGSPHADLIYAVSSRGANINYI